MLSVDKYLGPWNPYLPALEYHRSGYWFLASKSFAL